MNNVKDGSYILIQSWMIKDLELKGNELLIYAIIYGFSQADGTAFTGSLQYLADWTNSTKQGVIKNLKSLMEKGFVKKVGENLQKQRIFYKAYRVLNKVDQSTKFNGEDVDQSTEFNGTGKQSLIDHSTKFNGTVKQSLIVSNNIDNNINNNITTTNQEENLSKEINLEEKVSEEKSSSSSLIDFNFLKTYSGISDATRHNILKIKPDMTRQEFEQKFQTVKNENLKGNIKSFDAVLVKYIKGEWNIEIPVNSDSQVVPGGEVEMKAVKRIVFDCLSYIQFGWSRKDLLDKLNRDTSGKSNFVREKAMEMLVAELDRRGIS